MIPKIRITTHVYKHNADTVTPVGVYLRLRDKYPGTFLLESADYRGSENSFSFLCFDPLLSFSATGGEVAIESEVSGPVTRRDLSRFEVKNILFDLMQCVSAENAGSIEPLVNGFFGYMSYDAIQYFEDIVFQAEREQQRDIPEVAYTLFRFIVVFSHFNNELHIIANFDPSYDRSSVQSKVDDVRALIFSSNFQSTPFSLLGEESSNFDDGRHLEIIKACKRHISRGDVFQIVTSRRFSQSFHGDDFNVYRSLRSINPSPYLFYFDYGSFRLFGSSPEAQLQIKSGKASIFPIAGTYARSANRSDDQELALALQNDPKENAEHVMLVDLARNDLSKHCRKVAVETFKEVQFYSHVIHLVSKVSGELRGETSALEILGDTFPAGTLSGAPKYRAMQLIDQYEIGNRGYYGGTIGYMGLNGDCNQAIMIRSFLSKGAKLHYQAGAGVVFDSQPEKEVAEVRNKLGALRRAIEITAGDRR